MNRKLLVLAVIDVAAIVLIGSYEFVILPYKNRGPPTYPVTVYDDNSSVTVSGNFTSNYFSANATIVENGYPNSTLTISLQRGLLFFLPADNAVVIMANLVITGSIESNLHPSSFTIGASVLGTPGAYVTNTIFGAVSGPRYPPLQNTTDNDQFGLWGYGVSGNYTFSPFSMSRSGHPHQGILIVGTISPMIHCTVYPCGLTGEPMFSMCGQPLRD